MKLIMSMILLIVISINLKSQILLPLPTKEDFFAKRDDAKKLFFYGNGEASFEKLDINSISSKFATYYSPIDKMNILISINKSILSEKFSADSTDFNNAVFFPENRGFVFSGGIYYTLGGIHFRKNEQTKIYESALKKVEESEKDRIEKLKSAIKGNNVIIDSLNDVIKNKINGDVFLGNTLNDLILDYSIKSKEYQKEINDTSKSHSVKKAIEYKIPSDEVALYGNINFFNRNITTDSANGEKKFNGYNIDFGAIVSWYYYTQAIDFRAVFSAGFSYSEIVNGHSDYNFIFSKDSTKVIPTALRALGIKIAVQLNSITIGVNLKFYLGSKDKLIESLIGPKVMVTTAVNGNFFKF